MDPPLTSASGSPIVPALARKLKAKKRVANLVNPADPQEMSHSMSASFDIPEHAASPRTPASRPPSTSPSPLASRPPSAYTSPLASPPSPQHSPAASPLSEAAPNIAPPCKDDRSPKFPRLAQLRDETSASFAGNTTPGRDGVRGILRPAGTPGSGNGVRFFPKNKFRVITPNASALPPPSPAPAAPSFFSQLLAVLPSSPRVLPDESWEVPGQEGEVSLVASSAASFAEDEDEDEDGDGGDDEDGEARRAWTGVPEIISSPLGLPDVPSRDVSQEINLDAAGPRAPAADGAAADADADADTSAVSEWKALPEMSTLGSVRLTSPFGDSFTIDDATPLPRAEWGGAADQSGASERSVRSEHSERSERSMSRADNCSLDTTNPTIRLALPAQPTTSTIRSPGAFTPAGTVDVGAVAASPGPPPRAFKSIFADLSVDQAEVSWPLAPVASPSKTPRSVGDTTEFYDCVSMALSPGTPTPGPSAHRPAAAAQPSPLSMALQLSPAGSGPGASALAPRAPARLLAGPTETLFAAHDAHAAALGGELDLLRALVGRLQADVAERDAALAELNLRAVEAEMAAAASPSPAPLRQSRAPATPQLTRAGSRDLDGEADGRGHVGDRTTAAQAEVRDLEIRLAKAAAEADGARAAQRAAEADREAGRAAAARLEADLARAHERERELAIGAEKREADLRAALGTADDPADAAGALRAELARARDEAEDALGALDDVRAELARERDRADALEEAAERSGAPDDAELHALRGEVGRLEGEVESAEERAARAEEEAGRAAEEADRVEARAEEGERRAAELERALGEAEDREREWRRLADEAEGAREAERARRKDAERRLAEEADARAALETEVDELRASLAARPTAPAPASPSAAAARAEVARLRAESASKDLALAALQRRKAELKNDRELLNVALDSKQQELELIKRKYGVRGVAGATPLGESTRSNATAAYATPAPAAGRLRSSATAGKAATARRSGAAATPAPAGQARALGLGLGIGVGGFATPAPRWSHGVALSADTLPRAPRGGLGAKDDVRVAADEGDDDDAREPRYERRSLRRAMPA